LQSTVVNAADTFVLQVPGHLSLGTHQCRVDVIDPYGDVSSPSAPRTITVGNPAGSVVKSATVATSKGSVQSITVTFTGPMTTSSAGDGNNYALVQAEVNVRGGGGPRGQGLSVGFPSATARLARGAKGDFAVTPGPLTWTQLDLQGGCQHPHFKIRDSCHVAWVRLGLRGGCPHPDFKIRDSSLPT
jgi:hypothetical protein